jgi:hypothetical protein
MNDRVEIELDTVQPGSLGRGLVSSTRPKPDPGIGVEIDNRANRQEVEKIVRELMEGDKGKKMKKKVMEWKKLAEEANGPQGSSSINLNNLVNEVLL